ncbi:F-box and JmjC domain-containing protein [Morchella conica CCBAS932]|uniref:F-box and JmjC domain-containing protein n=1 Tax=Morchella conica CCBAS932 TaxID=1392247 RepID=A0A3N4KWG4_9PEZI|nr:F-box and JmjC domain-containing protein [Morchella conica CCBAS932]
MAPSTTLIDPIPSPPSKRQKIFSVTGVNIEADILSISDEKGFEDTATISSHPLRIKPSGNAYTSESNLRDTSTGLFAVFPDELIIDILGYLDAESLSQLGFTSRGLYAFSRHEELWKALFIESPKSKLPFTWRGIWRRTHLSLPFSKEVLIPTPDLFSDTLHRPFHMSQIPLKPYASKIPSQNAILCLPDMTAEDFNQKYSTAPFILTSPVKDWAGYKEWSIASLVDRYRDVRFRAESVDWRLGDYYDYMRDQTDESPLYLFDRAFVEKTGGELGRGFTVPECFGKDYFEVLGDERPDRRWMILGPERSGSTFHKDPNATSAWNAVIEGEKYWIMFPPGSPPPGVYESEDHSEVTSPLSIAEWLVGFHREARRTKGCREGICKAGEILYVPSGWWHLVVNLSPSLALTQNFIPPTQLSAAIEFLRDQPGSVSGFNTKRVRDPYGLFIKRMEEQYPVELQAALEKLEKKKKTKWGTLTDTKGQGFSFGFGCEDSDEE